MSPMKGCLLLEQYMWIDKTVYLHIYYTHRHMYLFLCAVPKGFRKEENVCFIL